MIERCSTTFTILILALAAFLPGCDGEDTRHLRVERVVDGDTFELSDGRTARLIGVDTPEKHMSSKLRRDAERSGQDVETIRALGERATQYAKKLAAGRAVELTYDQANAAQDHQDRYGRTLAYVWVMEEGTRQYMVNRRLIEDGYAYAYTQYPFKYSDRFPQLQREARAEERGLWSRGELAASNPNRGDSEEQHDPEEADRNCSDFDTQAEAQAFFDAAGPGDPHRLDSNNDDTPCESLR